MTHCRFLLRRRVLAAGAASAAALGSSNALFAQAPARVLRVGHQKGWLSHPEGPRGTLEKRLAPQLEALNVGSIDFGDVGEAPPIFAQGCGCAAGLCRRHGAATQARGGDRAEGFADPQRGDLKGKRVALKKGSNVHYFLVMLLEKQKG